MPEPTAIDVLRAACEAQFPEDHDWQAALARVEQLVADVEHVLRKGYVGKQWEARLRAALLAVSGQPAAEGGPVQRRDSERGET